MDLSCDYSSSLGFEQVSRLIAVVFLLSSSSELFSLTSSCKVLSENYWASYFHQASLGTHLNYQFLTTNSGTAKLQSLVDSQVCLYS